MASILSNIAEYLPDLEEWHRYLEDCRRTLVEEWQRSLDEARESIESNTRGLPAPPDLSVTVQRSPDRSQEDTKANIQIQMLRQALSGSKEALEDSESREEELRRRLRRAMLTIAKMKSDSEESGSTNTYHHPQEEPDIKLLRLTDQCEDISLWQSEEIELLQNRLEAVGRKVGELKERASTCTANASRLETVCEATLYKGQTLQDELEKDVSGKAA